VSEKSEISRRSFLSIATLGIGGLLALGLFVPGLIYLVAPFLKEQVSDEWLAIGPTSKVEVGTPTLFSAKKEQKTGWITNEEELTIYIYTEDGRDYVAMSNICTHLGCRVRWINDRQEFFCPCHNAVFDKQGEVVSGPPPKPLDQYEVKVVDDQIYIKAG
jgi:menaquinol-cytochrome c reductase iron-sulfur subunit